MVWRSSYWPRRPMPPRRFPPPWHVDEATESFCIGDANWPVLAYIYFETSRTGGWECTARRGASPLVLLRCGAGCGASRPPSHERGCALAGAGTQRETDPNSRGGRSWKLPRIYPCPSAAVG